MANKFATLTSLISFLGTAQKHQDNFNVLLSKKSREKFVSDYNAQFSGAVDYTEKSVKFDIDKQLTNAFKLIYRSQNTKQHIVVMSMTDVSKRSDLDIKKFMLEMELRQAQLDNDEKTLDQLFTDLYDGIGLSYNAHIFSMLLQMCGIHARTKREVISYAQENGVDKLDDNGKKVIASYQRHITLAIGSEAAFKKAFFLHLLNIAQACDLAESKEYITLTERQNEKLGIADFESAIAKEVAKLSEVVTETEDIENVA